MLSRIFTGTILSIGCILTVQAAEIAFDKAIEEFDTALAAPAQEAADPRTSGACDVPENKRLCHQGVLLAGELQADDDVSFECLVAGGGPVRFEDGTA